MTRNCNSCQRPYEAKRPSSRFCSDTCRKRKQRSPESEVQSDPAPVSSGLLEVTEKTLSDAGVLDTIAGQQAVELARRIGSPFETGSAVAAMSKQLQAVVTEALKSVQSADPLDELRRRRDSKRAAG